MLLSNVEIPAIQESMEREKRVRDYEDYQKGIDLVFGLSQSADENESEEIIKKANLAAEKRLSLAEGQDIYVDRKTVPWIEKRLGRVETRHYLGVYKEEVFDRIVNPRVEVPEGLQKLRSEAKKGLFMSEKVRTVTFGL